MSVCTICTCRVQHSESDKLGTGMIVQALSPTHVHHDSDIYDKYNTTLTITMAIHKSKHTVNYNWYCMTCTVIFYDFTIDYLVCACMCTPDVMHACVCTCAHNAPTYALY